MTTDNINIIQNLKDQFAALSTVKLELLRLFIEQELERRKK